MAQNISLPLHRFQRIIDHLKLAQDTMGELQEELTEVRTSLGKIHGFLEKAKLEKSGGI